MPYIVTTIDPVERDQSKYRDDAGTLRYSADQSEVFPGATGVRASTSSRRAVATLEEARMATEAICRAVRSAMPKPTMGEIITTGGRPHVPMAREIIRAIGESGGTIGPLPDGTVIAVERVGGDAQRPFIPPADMCVACHGEDGEHREDCIYAAHVDAQDR